MSFLVKNVAAAAVVLSFLSSPSPLAGQQLTFTTFAGPDGRAGSDDGTGSAARFGFPNGVATDSSGNVYVADTNNCTIRKVSPSGVVTTLAGLAGVIGSADGTGSAARFNFARGVATDSSGNVYVGDLANHTIRKITPAGVVTTLAGRAGFTGSADGTGSVARFHFPLGVATDSGGNVYVADQFNHAIRKVSPTGVVTTLAGLPENPGRNDGTGSAARFQFPNGVATDRDGNVYVGDTPNNVIRKITPAGVVTTLAGGFSLPRSLAVDGSGNVYVADQQSHTIRKITPAGVVTILAGSAGIAGQVDGTGSAARFNEPWGVATDSSGNVYVGDERNFSIRKVTPAGVVTTLAGTGGAKGSVDGTGSVARFNTPRGITTDSSGNVYVADQLNHTIRKISPAGVVTTLAGGSGTKGTADGPGVDARFNEPFGVAADSAGNVYVADQFFSTIRKITAAGVVSTFAGTPGTFGSTDGIGAAARFDFPGGLATDGADNVYVADQTNHTIRKITPAGVVTTLAGLAGSIGSSNGTGSAARFNFPIFVATDSVGNVYVAELEGHTIRKITPAGVVTTLAGLAGRAGSVDGTGSVARFNAPLGLAVDSGGNVLVADQLNHTIRKITPAGVVTTLAGVAGSRASVDGTGTTARFFSPSGLAIDPSGNVYLTDTGNHSIRVGRPALADAATIDLAAGAPGVLRQLDTSPATATSHLWSVIRRPPDSVAALSSTSIRNPTFTPDVAGLYTFRVTANGASSSSITTVNLNAGIGLSGDANNDGSVSVADVFYLISHLFTNGAAPVGPGDPNADGTVSVADVFYLINFLFAGGAAPR